MRRRADQNLKIYISYTDSMNFKKIFIKIFFLYPMTFSMFEIPNIPSPTLVKYKIKKQKL